MAKDEFYSRLYYAGLAPEPRFRDVLSLLAKKGIKADRLLDIGCGDGSFTEILKARLSASETVGIDIAAEAVASLDKKGIKGYQVDVDEASLPFPDGSFDMVYCGEVIEHVFNTDHLLAEIRRVLSANGVCVLTTPNLAGWPNRIALLMGYQPYPTAVSPSHEGAGKLLVKGDEGQWGHIRVFTAKALYALLRLNGLEVIAKKGTPVTVSSSAMPLISVVDRLFSRIPSMSTRIIVLIRKK